MADAARPDVSDADRHDSATALNAPNAIVLEQDQIAAAALRDALVAAGLRPLLATDQARFEACVRTGAFVLAVLDAGSVGRDPVARANALRLAASAARIVIGTDLAVREAVEWMRLGADDVLVKPIEPDEIADAVRRALERRALESGNFQHPHQLIGAGGMRQLLMQPRQQNFPGHGCTSSTCRSPTFVSVGPVRITCDSGSKKFSESFCARYCSGACRPYAAPCSRV